MIHYRTEFDPARHGFAFANRFVWACAPRRWRWAYGLCGGMCFAALDYWHAGQFIPTEGQPPARGRLWRWLVRRQLASWALPGGPLRVFVWMLRGDVAVLALTLHSELPKVARRLAQGEPAVLLLVRTAGLSHPTDNHQVAVVGLEQEGDVTTLLLYDPNYPGETTILRLTPSGARHSTGERARGFYVLNYTPCTRGLPEG